MIDAQTLPRTMRNVPLPAAMRLLPRNPQGYPIPWFVSTLPDGSRDFRVADAARQRDARRLNLCWVCGRSNGAYKAFTIGPMCALNRVSAEPPAHRDCAIYSARCCPFLATPQMVRRDKDLPAGTDTDVKPGGVAIMRNPGVALVWVTRTFTVELAPMGEEGLLWRFGEPTSLHWYCQGRDATRAEVLASIETGLPTLQEACQLDDDPEYSLAMLTIEHAAVLRLVPTA